MSDARKIITIHEKPSIPTKEYDWSASREDYELGDHTGFGRTEQDAIDHLKELES